MDVNKASPLFQGGLEISIKVFVQWYNINGIKILQEHENYMHDSKEILKSLLGDDIEEEEDYVTSERRSWGMWFWATGGEFGRK